MTQPFLSIVTISFNQVDYLRECLDSVLAEGGADLEYIVCDPGSTDGSREVLAGYADRITLVLDPDRGPADGLRQGFARATGRVGYFINSDDFLLPGAVARLRRAWEAAPDTELMLGGAWIIDGAGAPVQEIAATPITRAGLASGRDVMVQHGMSFTMDLYRRAGGFNPENRTCWDHELLCDMLAQDPRVTLTPERFGVFRVHETSRSGGGHGDVHEQRYRADLARIAQRHGVSLAEKPSRLAQVIGDPLGMAGKLIRRATPGQMQRRWAADMAGPGA